MPSRFEKYRVKDGLTRLGEAYFNPVFQDIDLRLTGLEALRISWDEAVRAVSDYGLVRINEVLAPALTDANDKTAEIEARRLAAVDALAALQAMIADLETSTADDLTAWKATQLAAIQAWKDDITPSLPALDARLDALESVPTFTALTYANRASLRAGTPVADQKALVEGLGLFIFYAGSDEPDDDESCFATASGRWLLQAAHWDLVDAWQLPDDAARDEDDEDEPLRLDKKLLTGSATCGIASLTATTSASFTGTVTGAAVGDRVIATPPAQLGSTGADTSRLNYHAWVSAADTVTVMLCNPSAATANTNAAIQTAWPVTVIKT